MGKIQGIEIVGAVCDGVKIERFRAVPGQAWCILGRPGSGLTRFFRLVSGNAVPDKSVTLSLPQDMGSVSFKDQQDIYEQELKNDETDFMDRPDPGTLARSFFQDPHAHQDLIKAFGMAGAMDKGYRQLSTGQSRKLLLLSRISRGLSCLVVQNPYDGLDPMACRELDSALARLGSKNTLIMVFINNVCDIPGWCTHMGIMAGQALATWGPKEKVMGALDQTLLRESADFRAKIRDIKLGDAQGLYGEKHALPQELVRLRKGAAGYQGKKVFRDLDLVLYEGDHTLVSGPNGCGKSTLLQVVTGDHPACYQNDLRVFGITRGSGESIWDLKRHMGIVSSELHRNYLVPGNTLHCILSGLFDSIGLYQPYTPKQEKMALMWLDRLDMAADARTPFRDLDYARQRLVLIARALIKVPRLLVLDEPTQGLDQCNRTAVLDFLESIAQEKLSTILFVSHRKDEFRSFFVHHLEMGKKKGE